jgi:hypothetical protein
MKRRPHRRLPEGGYVKISSVRMVWLNCSPIFPHSLGRTRGSNSRLRFGDLHDLDLSRVDLWSCLLLDWALRASQG